MSQTPAPKAPSEPHDFQLSFSRGQAADIMDDLPLGHSVSEATRDLYRRLRQELRHHAQGEPVPRIPDVTVHDGVMTAPPQPVRPAPDRLPRRAIVVRTVDVTGISGVGHIAEICEFSDGKGVIRWLGGAPQNQPKLEFYDNLGIEPFLQISGHNGNTKVIWIDEDDQDV